MALTMRPAPPGTRPGIRAAPTIAVAPAKNGCTVIALRGEADIYFR